MANSPQTPCKITLQVCPLVRFIYPIFKANKSGNRFHGLLKNDHLDDFFQLKNSIAGGFIAMFDRRVFSPYPNHCWFPLNQRILRTSSSIPWPSWPRSIFIAWVQRPAAFAPCRATSMPGRIGIIWMTSWGKPTMWNMAHG